MRIAVGTVRGYGPAYRTFFDCAGWVMVYHHKDLSGAAVYGTPQETWRDCPPFESKMGVAWPLVEEVGLSVAPVGDGTWVACGPGGIRACAALAATAVSRA